jgi:nicotinate-nucleotide pyrophosphorylase (carboxylating)
MFPSDSLSRAILREAASRALGEDRGPADLTSLATVPEDCEAEAVIFPKEAAILAGMPVAEQVFTEEDARIQFTALAEDGAKLDPGTRVLRVRGPGRAILTAERTALNFLQHLSGIATETRRYVEAVEGTGAQILDTRKTVPGLRHLEKYAVKCGGGTNHRMGLYDQFLIKDNHLLLMGGTGGLREAVERARALSPDLKIEVEADTLEQVREIVSLGVDIILLDNMSNEQLSQAVALVAGRARTEASGNMTLERVRSVAETGVDYISVGALTHSVRAIDFSLEIVP